MPLGDKVRRGIPHRPFNSLNLELLNGGLLGQGLRRIAGMGGLGSLDALERVMHQAVLLRLDLLDVEVALDQDGARQEGTQPLVHFAEAVFNRGDTDGDLTRLHPACQQSLPQRQHVLGILEASDLRVEIGELPRDGPEVVMKIMSAWFNNPDRDCVHIVI